MGRRMKETDENPITNVDEKKNINVKNDREIESERSENRLSKIKVTLIQNFCI